MINRGLVVGLVIMVLWFSLVCPAKAVDTVKVGVISVLS